MINSSNFFLNNFFELENSPCECKKETVYTAPGVDPSYVLKVCAKPDSDTLRFSYSAQKGLNQSGNAGGVINENILGDSCLLSNLLIWTVLLNFYKSMDLFSP